MNKFRQFRALFRFQTTINPFIWFMPLVFGTSLLAPLITGSISKTYHPSFFVLLVNQNLFFVGIFGAMVLAPERFQMGAANISSVYYGTEFILTRAIDRAVLYRAKAAVLFLMVLLLPCINLAHSLRDPNVVVSEYSEQIQEKCLAIIPGSTLLPSQYKYIPSSLIAIPRGNILSAEWQLWMFLLSAVSLQVLILILYPFRFARVVFWLIFISVAFAPLLEIFSKSPSPYDLAFFSFAAHPALFWVAAAVAFVLAQLWCERRFAELEQ